MSKYFITDVRDAGNIFTLEDSASSESMNIWIRDDKSEINYGLTFNLDQLKALYDLLIQYRIKVNKEK